MKYLIALGLFAICSISQAGDNEALAQAAADLRTLPREEQIYTRYVWITDADFESVQAVALTINYVSRGTVLVRPLPFANNSMVRINLRAYAPREADLKDMVSVWEQFQFDPKFNLLLTADTIKFATQQGFKVPEQKAKTKEVEKKVEPYVKDGQMYNTKWVKETVAEVELVRVVSEHLDKTLVATLVDGTQSQAPIVSHPYFVTRALSQIQGKGIAKTIYGGLYYQLSGIKTGAKKGTDEDVLLESLGIGNVEAGITAATVFEKLRSDQRVAIFKSSVTSKPRRIDLLRTLAGRDGQGIVSITHDLKDEDIDIGTHPIMNLLNFKDAARELIAEKPNGLHLFALLDGNGKLQDEAPPDVVADSTIPTPNGTRLQPAISCIRCHGPDSGLKKTTNDVKKLLNGYLDVFGDRSGKNIPDTVDRIAGLYAGDLEVKVLPRARDDYNGAILRASGPWKKSKGQTDIAKLSAEKIATVYKSYVYDTIDAKAALAELGVKYDGKDPSGEFKRLLPPVAIVDGIVPEDPRIAALMAGLAINRTDWDLTYSFVATRIHRGGKRPEQAPAPKERKIEEAKP